MNTEIMRKFYEAWHFLNEHKYFEREVIKGYRENRFQDALEIDAVRVDPTDNTVNWEDDTKNTKVEIWLECGRWMTATELSDKSSDNPLDGAWSHDISLDCGGDTFEEAIIRLAELVQENYGTEKCDEAKELESL